MTKLENQDGQKLKAAILALIAERDAALAHAAALRRMLNHHHAKASEECEVYFKDDVDKFGVVERGTTDLGRAYEESELCERTLAALTASDEQAIERERGFQEAVKNKS